MPSTDDILEARAQRSALWRQASAGEITTAELYAALAKLRAAFGDLLYPVQALGARRPRP